MEDEITTTCIEEDAKRKHYQLLRQIGSNSKTTLYVAKNQDGEQVMLTFLDRDRMVERYEMLLEMRGRTREKAHEEAVAWGLRQQQIFRETFERIKNLAHEHVAEAFEFGSDPQREKVTICSEYVPGIDLLTAVSHLPLFHQLPIHVRVLRGLKFIHDNGFLHLNLKPRRIRINLESHPATVKLVDFGFAIPKKGYEGDYSGTPLYMAPEVVRGERDKIDERADLYSFAALVYASLTGHHPFQHRDRAGRDRQRLQQIVEKEGIIAPPSHYKRDIPQELDELLLALLNKDPNERRFRNANEVLSFLKEKWPKRIELMPTEASTLLSDE